MHPFISPLNEQLHKIATEERRTGSEAYLRNQFKCIGVDTTARRNMFKEYLRNCTRPSYTELPGAIQEMWQMKREIQLCAVELGSLYKKEWTKDFIDTIEYCILHDSWWDTVDHIASEWTGPYFKLYPAQIKRVTGRWNRSKNIWLQRSSIMFQKQYKKQTDTALLSKYMLHCAGSNEFFIQKAIGWALREYRKTDPVWVKKFVKTNELKPLSKREAMKNIS